MCIVLRRLIEWKGTGRQIGAGKVLQLYSEVNGSNFSWEHELGFVLFLRHNDLLLLLLHFETYIEKLNN